MAGMVTSVHCAGMCGPLTCALLPQRSVGRLCQTPGRDAGGAPRPASDTDALQLGVYHASRAAAYIAIGGVLGALGKSAASIFTSSPAQFLPWVLIAVFAVIGLGLEKKLPVPGRLSALLFKLRFSGAGKTKLAALIGLATPFLPCAPLYLVFGVALFSGSFFAGGKLMACFAAGTMPLYWLLQSQVFRLQTMLPPFALSWTRKGLAWVSVALLTWRAVAGHGAGLSQLHCPFCQ